MLCPSRGAERGDVQLTSRPGQVGELRRSWELRCITPDTDSLYFSMPVPGSSPNQDMVIEQPLPSEQGTPSNILTTFTLKMKNGPDSGPSFAIPSQIARHRKQIEVSVNSPE